MKPAENGQIEIPGGHGCRENRPQNHQQCGDGEKKQCTHASLPDFTTGIDDRTPLADPEKEDDAHRGTDQREENHWKCESNEG